MRYTSYVLKALILKTFVVSLDLISFRLPFVIRHRLTYHLSRSRPSSMSADHGNQDNDSEAYDQYTGDTVYPPKAVVREACAKQAHTTAQQQPPEGGANEHAQHQQGCARVIAAARGKAEARKHDCERQDRERVGKGCLLYTS